MLAQELDGRPDAAAPRRASRRSRCVQRPPVETPHRRASLRPVIMMNTNQGDCGHAQKASRNSRPRYSTLSRSDSGACQTREGSNEDRSLGHGNPEGCTGGGQIIVCVSIIRRGAAAANYAVYCLPDCSTITHLTLNRLPLQHRREGFYNWISRSTSKPFCSSHSGCPGGGLPPGALSYFAYRLAMADLQAFRDR